MKTPTIVPNNHIIYDTKRKYNDLVKKYIRVFESNIRNGKFQHSIREDRFSCKLIIDKLDNDYIDRTFIGCCGSKKTKLIISYREK